MKLYFMKQDAVDFMKHNMDRLYPHYFQDDNNDWIKEEYGSDPFSEFMEVPDFELADLEAMSIGEADFENCKILYNNLRLLSESQCSDERLWAGLCNGVFYDYMRRRYSYDTKQLSKKQTDSSNVISRFFFSGGTRSGFYRNTLAKCWWVGRATYDKNNENHFEKLDIIGPNDLVTKVSDIFYSNTFASNPKVLTGICNALKFFNDRGIKLNEKGHVRASMKYLNAVGGASLLDILSEEEISDLIIKKIASIMKGNMTDIDLDALTYEDEIADEFSAGEERLDSNIEQVSEMSENNSENNDEALSSNASEQAAEKDISGPEYISYGCWATVFVEETDRKITYHLPLKSDYSRSWFDIERTLLGKKVEDSFYLAGKNYRVIAFGYDNESKDTRPEFSTENVQVMLETEMNETAAEDDFYDWLREEGFIEKVIEDFRPYIDNSGLLEIKDTQALNDFEKERAPIFAAKEKTVLKYYRRYLDKKEKDYKLTNDFVAINIDTQQTSEELEEQEEMFYDWLRKRGFVESVISKIKKNQDIRYMLRFTDIQELKQFVQRRMSLCDSKDTIAYKYYLEYYEEC